MAFNKSNERKTFEWFYNSCYMLLTCLHAIKCIHKFII